MGGTIFGFYGGDTAVMRGDIELMGGPPSPPSPPPTRENPDVGLATSLDLGTITEMKR